MNSDKEYFDEEQKTISVKLPQLKLPTLQAGILILLIIVGALQTVQLYGLSLRIPSGQTTENVSVSSPSTSTDSVTSSLPSMVGGC